MNGRLQIETVSSLVLKGNPLGDPRRREVPVYLPPSYGAKRGRRYPVIFYLPGFTGTGRGSVNCNPWKENVVERFDRLISTGKSHEAILVIPDCFTAFGGSQYLNSGATG
ncbi:MAG: esterase, partial [Elusimicrobiota bacterium]